MEIHKIHENIKYTVSEVIRWADAVCVSGCTALVELSVSHQIESERERERDQVHFEQNIFAGPVVSQAPHTAPFV